MTITNTANIASTDRLDELDQILPENTPLYIGPGIVIEGDITFRADKPDQRLVVLGEVRGNIYTNATLQVAEGGVVNAKDSIECAEIVAAGTINGDGVKIKANLFMLKSTGRIKVDTLHLPPGGLEQSRGGVLNARLDMSDEHEKIPVASSNLQNAFNAEPTVAQDSVQTQSRLPSTSAVTSTMPGKTQDSVPNSKFQTALQSALSTSSSSANTKDPSLGSVSPMGIGGTANFAVGTPGPVNTGPVVRIADEVAMKNA